MSSIKKISGVVLASAVLALAGCGGEDSGTGTLGGTTTVTTNGATDGTTTSSSGTGTTTTGSTDSSASTIVLTYPITESIENLGGGVYRRIGKAIVTDNEGNPVPDGTNVFFNVIDSTIAMGTITSVNGDGISGSVLTDYNPSLANGVATTFSTAYVIRNEATRYINPGDHLYLKGFNSSDYANSVPNADAEDKNRIISTDTGAISGNTLKVTQDYVSIYPNSAYASGGTDYIVGASLLGAKVLGKTYDDAGEPQYTNLGYATTKNGIAEFVVDYPATRRELNTGCDISAIDERSLPLGSANVLVVASAGAKAITVDDNFCFAPIAPFIVGHEADPVVSAGAAASEWLVPVNVADANKVDVPYSSVGFVAASSSQLLHILDVDLLDEDGNPTSYTDRDGWVYVYLKLMAESAAKSSDEATIVVTAGKDSGSTTIKATVLADPNAATVEGLSISPSAPIISKIPGGSTKTSSVGLTLTDSAGIASKTVYARVTETINKGGLTVSLSGGTYTYNATLDLYSYTTDSNGQFTSQITVSGGAGSDAATITYYYGTFEAKATVTILAAP